MHKNTSSQKVSRITKTRDYQHVFLQGRKFIYPEVILFTCPKNDGMRYGIIASKKVGNAIVRNRAKRRLREIMRELSLGKKMACDIVVIARSRAHSAKYHEIRRSISKGLYKFDRSTKSA